MEKWIVWVASCVRVFFFSGSMKSNGVVLEDIVVQLDTNHALVGWAFGLQNGMAYLFAPCTRFLLKTFSHRQVASIGGFLTGAGYIYFGLRGCSVYQLLIGFSVSGIGFGLTTLPSYLNLEQHFPDTFPLMISLVSPFNFVGVALLPPVLQFLQSEYGLNHGLVLFGAIVMNLIPCGVALRAPSPSRRKAKPKQVDQADDNKKTPADDAPDVKTEEQTIDHGKYENQKKSCIKFGDKYLFFVSSLFHHPNFAIVAVLEFAAIYLYTSWALFLVSLGVTAGLQQREAVYLSSVGGIGGLVGTILAAVVFRIGKPSPYVACFLPFFSLITLFVLYTFVTNFYFLLVMSGGSGLLLGYINTTVFGILPSLICRLHFQQAIVFSFVLDGIATQFGGLFSGLLQDIFKSTRAIYFSNAVLSLSMLPLTVMWACNNQPTKQCGNFNQDEPAKDDKP